MEPCKTFPLSFRSSNLIVEPEKSKKSYPIQSNFKNKPTEIAVPKTTEGQIGFLDVFIHEARDIHNICIYHKQDVYAKLHLTDDPKSTISAQIINGGGRNPVFNQNLRLNVRNIDASLKCEIWMLSRVKNYLEDQLLGFALVPLSEVIVANGKLEQESSLSSNDLFHSPAGFVRLSAFYTGSLPEVLAITPRTNELLVDENDECQLEKIEFPDLNIVNENKMMVSEYFGIPCTNLDSQGDEETLDVAGVRVVECLAKTSPDPVENLNNDAPLSSVSTNGSPNEKEESIEGKTESFAPPVISINIEPNQSVVQQDIVDMYMKSMQQFSDSLANMKLPMEFENNSTSSSSSSENGGSEPIKKLQELKKTGSRVFYGSGAFF